MITICRKAFFYEQLKLEKIFFFEVLTKDPDLFFMQGLNYMNTGRLVIAKGFYHKYLEYEPKNADCWNLIGFCISKYTWYRESIKYFRRAIPFGGNESNMYANLGEAYFRRKIYSKSLRCLQKAHLMGGVRDKKRLYDFMFDCIENDFFETQRQGNDIGDWSYLVANDLKKALNVDNIICLGDSHTLIIQGVNCLDVFQARSPTAYNLMNENSQSKSIRIIRDLLKCFKPKHQQ